MLKVVLQVVQSWGIFRFSQDCWWKRSSFFFPSHMTLWNIWKEKVLPSFTEIRQWISSLGQMLVQWLKNTVFLWFIHMQLWTQLMFCAHILVNQSLYTQTSQIPRGCNHPREQSLVYSLKEKGFINIAKLSILKMLVKGLKFSSHQVYIYVQYKDDLNIIAFPLYQMLITVGFTHRLFMAAFRGMGCVLDTDIPTITCKMLLWNVTCISQVKTKTLIAPLPSLCKTACW